MISCISWPPADFLKKYKKIDARKEESKWMEKRWRDEYEKDPLKCAPTSAVLNESMPRISHVSSTSLDP